MNGHAGDPYRWFGTGLNGLAAMFAVWGEPDPNPVARVPLRRAATRPIGQLIDTEFIDRMFATPHRPRRLVDPRTLRASQHGVTHGGVRYYLTEPRYRRSGRTWADQWSRINREVVVWAPAPDGPQLLSGHHRTTAALLRGEPIEVLWLDPGDPATGAGVRFTPLLWSGTCPLPAHRGASVAASVAAVLSDVRTILGSTDAAGQAGQARRALRALGVDDGWADSLVSYATSGRLA